MPQKISIAIPMYNEAAGLDALFARLEQVLCSLGMDYEIVCVNDGSNDATLEGLLQHRERNGRIVIVDLSRNFGKDIALTAALDHCDGDAVVPMDADLQDPPEVIPEMVEKWREGYDMVIARRGSRESDTPMKQHSAELFYRFFNRVSTAPIPANAGDFRLLDRRVVEALRRFPESNRFMKGLFAWVGYRQTEIVYDREAREAGKSKFNYWKLWNFAIDGIVAFSSMPLRVWSYLGAAVSLGSILYGFYLVVRTIIHGIDVPGYASTMVAILFLGGIQLISLGVIGEYLSRMYDEMKRRPLYLVREVWSAVSPKRQNDDRS